MTLLIGKIKNCWYWKNIEHLRHYWSHSKQCYWNIKIIILNLKYMNILGCLNFKNISMLHVNGICYKWYI
jgi:hypothetical protein